MVRSGGFIVVDIGNSRVKWGEINAAEAIIRSDAIPIDRPDLWTHFWNSSRFEQYRNSLIAVSSVNPPMADEFEQFLQRIRNEGASPTVRWYRSAADVPVAHLLEFPETAGADRALAVVGVLASLPEGRPGLVISCGTAITIERITRERVWQGGAILPGLGLVARALNQNTAQLPLVRPGRLPPAWGNSTRPALEAGIFWGVVGGVRELMSRQLADLEGDPWIVWTGGDADIIAGPIAGQQANVAPHLVLQGLICISDSTTQDSGIPSQR